jgi:hypothetical protein
VLAAIEEALAVQAAARVKRAAARALTTMTTERDRPQFIDITTFFS